MALDPRIPLMAQGINLEPRSNALMRAAQLQGTQDTNALRQMQMQQMQQAAQQTLMERQAAAQKQAQLEAALKAIPSPQGQAIASLGRNASPTNANAQRMPQVDPRAQQLWEMMQAGLVKPKEYMDVAYQQPEFMVAGPGSGIVDKRTGSVKSNIPFKPEAQKLPAVGELQAFRDGLPEGDPRKREVQGVIDNMTRPPKYASAPAGGAGASRPPEAVKPPPKPLPTSALKMQQDALDAIGIVGGINADLKALEGQITDGTLAFGPVKNLVSAGKNMVGASDTQSRNFATFKSNMERLRNESLRLNTGVQTDGDAQRAWNELFQNINDTDLVKQRLQEIQRINDRGAELQRLKVDQVRMNYGLDPLDVTPQLQQKPALTGGGPAVGAVVDGYRFKGGNPADPKSWEKQ